MKRSPLLAATQLVLVAAVLACTGVLAARHPWRLDLTPEHRFTLSTHTRTVLASLPAPVTATYFYNAHEHLERQTVDALLRLYADASPRFRLRTLDLDRRPGEAHRLRVDAYNVVVLESGDRVARVDVPNEEFLTAALVRLAGGAERVAYVVQGHGEGVMQDPEGRNGLGGAARTLEAEGFTTRPLLGTAIVPADAALVLLAGPARGLQAAEVEGLAAFVARGGGLLVLTAPPTPPSVAGLLARVGIEPGDDLVVDERSRLLGADELTARVAYLNQSLVPAGLEVSALLPLAQTVRVVDHADVDGDYLAITGDSAWADVDRRALAGKPFPFRPGIDRPGPLPVAAYAAEAHGGRMVVVGDVEFATNLHLDLLGNRDLLAAVASLAAEGRAEAGHRPGRPPAATFSPLVLSTRESHWIVAIGVVLPSLLFFSGGWLAWRRGRT